MATVYLKDFIDDVLENIAQAGERQINTASRRALHEVGEAIQDAALKNGIDVKIRYQKDASNAG